MWWYMYDLPSEVSIFLWMKFAITRTCFQWLCVHTPATSHFLGALYLFFISLLLFRSTKNFLWIKYTSCIGRSTPLTSFSTQRSIKFVRYLKRMVNYFKIRYRQHWDKGERQIILRDHRSHLQSRRFTNTGLETWWMRRSSFVFPSRY